MQPDPSRAPVSANRNGAQVGALSGGTALAAVMLVPYLNQWRGLTYDQATYLAAGIVTVAAYLAGVVGSVARDELHRYESSTTLAPMSPWRRMLLTALSGLG